MMNIRTFTNLYYTPGHRLYVFLELSWTRVTWMKLKTKSTRILFILESTNNNIPNWINKKEKQHIWKLDTVFPLSLTLHIQFPYSQSLIIFSIFSTCQKKKSK